MKKALALILAGVMLFSFAACKGSTDDIDTETKESGAISAQESLMNVTVTMAASFFKGETEQEIMEAAQTKGIKECVINEDGSVTYTMSKSKHKQLLKEMKKSLDETLAGMLEGENKVESFVKIEANDDFSKIDVYVDPEKYTIWDSMNAMSFYVSGTYYQSLSGVDFDKLDVLINFIDDVTGEILETASYREFMDNQAENE